MIKILETPKAIKVCQKLKKEGKKIVVCGGCFDILHIGHIKFLEKAKKSGDVLFVLLESDENVKKIKGKKRPINSQGDRSIILSSLVFVDYVVLLDKMDQNKDYDNLIRSLNPDIIAVTKNDPQIVHNKRQAKEINAKVIPVVGRIRDKSTTRIAEIISKDF